MFHLGRMAGSISADLACGDGPIYTAKLSLYTTRYPECGANAGGRRCSSPEFRAYNGGMRRPSHGLMGWSLTLVFAGATAARPQAIPRNVAPQAATPANAVPAQSSRDQGRDELRTGAALTRSGALRDAIPHLLAARAAGADPYATGVNLAICYVGTGASAQAIPLLESLRSSGYRTPATATLLVQAYIATNRAKDAYDLLSAASAAAPGNETIFAYAADACTDAHRYSLGLRMVDLGLAMFPASARLHYEKALFLAQLDKIEEARPEFDRAADLDPNGYIGCLARVQKDLHDDDLKGANLLLEQAIHAGRSDYRMLSLLGTVLLDEGVGPGDPRFPEAQSALEESARERPDFSATQIALGKIDLMLGQYREAVQHLEAGRALEPDNPAVYTSLAVAYRHLGEREKASQASAELGQLLSRQAVKASQPGDSSPR
jgi:predicted Zn-dependent protease